MRLPWGHLALAIDLHQMGRGLPILRWLSSSWRAAEVRIFSARATTCRAWPFRCRRAKSSTIFPERWFIFHFQSEQVRRPQHAVNRRIEKAEIVQVVPPLQGATGELCLPFMLSRQVSTVLPNLMP